MNRALTDPWRDHPVPPMRREALRGDRVVRCFADRPRSFHALFARAVAERPDHEALVCDGRRWRYRDCEREVARIAAGFAGLGIARGDRVAMLVGNRPEFVFVLFALQRLGAIAVPIGVREQRPGLAWMLDQCGACAIVFDAELAARVPDPREVPSLRHRIAIGAEGAGLDAVQWLHRLSVGADANAMPAAVDEQDTAVILYTSGTTGHPKGAMLTHLNIAHSVRHFESCMRLVPDDRGALAVPASHVTGLIATIASMVHVGATIVVVPEFKASEFIALAERERITHTLMVPAMYKLCLLSPDFAGRDLRAWRIGGYGGAPMPVATIEALAQSLPGLVLVNAYGATETTSPTTIMPAAAPGASGDEGRAPEGIDVPAGAVSARAMPRIAASLAHADTVGVPVPCADVVVMDDDGREVAAGEPGELWIAGPMVVPGYWDNPAATAASFTAGYWHSGDLGSVDAEGYVRIFDRKKDMLNRGGFKIYSVEVENALMGCAGVVEAAIVARACPVLGERVHAFIHAPDAAHDDDAVRAHCRARLADYKVPETITWTDAPLPRNANGKVMKRLLRDRLEREGAAAART